jgi:hypothetical protein
VVVKSGVKKSSKQIYLSMHVVRRVIIVILYIFFIPVTLLSTRYSLLSTLYSLLSTLYSLLSTLYSLLSMVTITSFSGSIIFTFHIYFHLNVHKLINSKVFFPSLYEILYTNKKINKNNKQISK